MDATQTKTLGVVVKFRTIRAAKAFHTALEIREVGRVYSSEADLRSKAPWHSASQEYCEMAMNVVSEMPFGNEVTATVYEGTK